MVGITPTKPVPVAEMLIQEQANPGSLCSQLREAGTSGAQLTSPLDNETRTDKAYLICLESAVNWRRKKL